MHTNIVLFLTLILSFSFHSYGQLEIESISKKKKTIEEILESGSGIDILKVRYKGSDAALGYFKGGMEILNLDDGIILSTGNTNKISRPNKNSGTTGYLFGAKSKTLSKMTKLPMKDASEIKIEFTAEHEYISFNFVFGSEEYPEFVGSSFNDAYAFILSGPGISGEKNLATIPESNEYVSINNINHGYNQQYYVHNSHEVDMAKTKVRIDTNYFRLLGLLYAEVITYNFELAFSKEPQFEIEFDGFTRAMQMMHPVVPGETYELTIVIADASDRRLDSGVFIEGSSFNSHEDESFKYGALAQDGYYYSVDTVRIFEETDTIIPPEIAIIPCVDTTIHLLFETNIFELDETAKEQLTTLINGLETDQKTYSITITGHTDNIADNAYNQELGQKRADNAAAFINAIENLEFSVETVDSKGEKEVFKDNKTAEGRRLNRRVEVHFHCE